MRLLVSDNISVIAYKKIIVQIECEQKIYERIHVHFARF